MSKKREIKFCCVFTVIADENGTEPPNIPFDDDFLGKPYLCISDTHRRIILFHKDPIIRLFMSAVHAYYRPQRSWGKVMFLQVCVILFTGRGVPDQVPPRPGTPWTKYTPQTRYPPSPGLGTPPWDQVHPPRTRYSLPGPGTPPTRYTPLDQVHPQTRYTPLDQVHPPGPGTPPQDQGDTVYARAVRILLECNLVRFCFTTQNNSYFPPSSFLCY